MTPSTETTAARAPKILIEEIKAKDFVKFGTKHLGEVAVGHKAEVVKNKSIRLFGTSPNRTLTKDSAGNYTVPCAAGPAHDVTFNVGDKAIAHYSGTYDLGTITAISPTTIVVVEYLGTRSERTRRMSLSFFDMYNHDFVLAEVRAHNANHRD